MSINIKQYNQDIIISDYNNFDIIKTFESGQCFRWNQQDDGSYIGVVGNSVITVYQENNKIIFKNLLVTEYKNKIIRYFDLDTDYEIINNSLLDLYFINEATKYSSGIRILKQDPWEVLISFIISQNNNISRIKKIIERFCEKFGKKIIDNYFEFPKIDDIKNISIGDLDDLKCGFRDKYILDAILKIKNKEIILENLYELNIDEARRELMKIKGVGPKVADCVLLYGFSKTDSFPTDTWIKKTINKFFQDGLPKIKKEYLGIVQQYIYYYVRNNNRL
ncbi:MAG: DNA-3-methyladenine glycosylase 2 family protein [Oscillospiraceae bacterium]|nr:DNA-3-methyladenine glycosylase 2 family protein [Oscillospiraceae bacterium]